MYICIKRSGGFTGIPMQAEVDTSKLPADQAEAIENMLVDADFFELTSDPDQVNEADRFTYELKVVRDEVEHTIYFSEQNAPVEINSPCRTTQTSSTGLAFSSPLLTSNVQPSRSRPLNNTVSAAKAQVVDTAATTKRLMLRVV